MQQTRKIVIYLLYIFYLCVGAFYVEGSAIHEPRLWTKIPKYYVDDRVYIFLNENRITNCFEYQYSQTNLLLKCWRENQLMDVSIKITPSKKQRKYRNFIEISMSI